MLQETYAPAYVFLLDRPKKKFPVSFFPLAALIYRRQVMAVDNFEEMVRDCGPVVYRFLLSLCGDAGLAEELTAETFCRAWLQIDRFRGECRVETWLCQIAKHALYKERRRTKGHIPWEQAEEGAYDGALLERLADKEQDLRVFHQLHRLEEPYREVFMLRVLGELKFKEIAAVCGRTESWAKVTFYRAKDKLIEGMEERYEDQL